MFGEVYFRSQKLKHPSIGEYWNISGVPVLPENVIIFRKCWCYPEANNTEMHKNSLVLSTTCVPVSETYVHDKTTLKVSEILFLNLKIKQVCIKSSMRI